MSARNPYERRRGPHDHHADWASGGIFTVGQAGVEQLRRSPIEFEDLEALVHHARRREMRAQQAEQEKAVHTARREAWEEGHATGVAEGEDAVLRRGEQLFGDELEAARKATLALLADHEEEPRRVSKADLVARLDRHKKLLDKLQRSWAQGFHETPVGEA